MAEMGTLLLVGTGKGLFVLQRPAGADKWSIDGPHFAGRAVYSAFYDDRKGRSDIWAAATSWHFGAELLKSTDMGATWDEPERMRIKMPANTKKSLENIWQITPGTDPNTIYVGAQPAALFESHDGGETFKLNKGLWSHPHREKWTPGFGGLAVHTVVTDKKDPNDIKIGFDRRLDNGDGANWHSTPSGVFPARSISEFGQCTQDRAILRKRIHTFSKITMALPCRDGRPPGEIESGYVEFARPHGERCGSVFIVPDWMGNVTCDGKQRLSQPRRRKSWELLAKGLPQKNAYEVILATRPRLSAAIFSLGQTAAGSGDDGDSWKMIEGSLPEIASQGLYFGLASWVFF